MIMPHVLHIFAPCNLQQFKYSKTSTVYVFLTANVLCARPVHLVIVRLKIWMGEDSACQYASCAYNNQNKAQ
jgi:hypothetical protein